MTAPMKKMNGYCADGGAIRDGHIPRLGTGGSMCGEQPYNRGPSNSPPMQQVRYFASKEA